MSRFLINKEFVFQMRSNILALVLILFSALPFYAQTVKNADLLKQILDLPAPPPKSLAEEANKKDRSADFANYKNIPPDDAPIDDLTDYWASQTGDPLRFTFRPEMTDKTAERLLDYCEENPEETMKFLNMFPAKPEVADRVKSLYDKLMNGKNSGGYDEYEYSTIRSWLKYNSIYYVDELIREAQKIKDVNDYISNDSEYALRSLAKVDWNSASSIITRLELDFNNPYSQILAKWAAYQHAMDEKNASDIEKYRNELKEIVESKDQFWRKRDLAMDALVAAGDWEGRDEWYMSLLQDETLLKIQDNSHTGLTTLMNASAPDKYLEKMIELTKSDSLAIRSAAVRNLMNRFSGQKDIAAALLPWLTNPNWVKQSAYSERRNFINQLGEIDLPESIPGLLAVLANEEEMQIPAATALAKYKDPRAIPPLRLALANAEVGEARATFINALLACGGFSDDEQMSALEAYAVMMSTPEGREKIQNQMYGNDVIIDFAPRTSNAELPVQISIGMIVANQTEPTEGLVLRVIQRVKTLRRTKPAVAETLAEFMRKWQGRAIYVEMFRQIETGEANTDVIIGMLAKRKDVREKIPSQVALAHNANGILRGIAACISEDSLNYTGILNHTDREAQTALLGCARLIRAKLPVNEVGGFLKSPDKMQVLAAERYLESEDSAPARNLILANRPNEAAILGARQAFFTGGNAVYDSTILSSLFESVNGNGFWSDDSDALNKSEKKLQKEIKDDANLTAVFGLLPDAEAGQQIIKVYKDRIVYTFYEDAARFRERTLTAKEYEAFYQFLVADNIDGLSNIGSSCEECVSTEFVMFGKAGGRRVFIESVYDTPKVISKLIEQFENFKKSDLKLKYLLADKLKGLEILLADEKFPAYSVWKKDGDLRFLVEDVAKGEENEKSLNEEFKAQYTGEQDETTQKYELMAKRRQEMAFAHYSWRNLENGRLGGAILSQPAETLFLSDETENEAAPNIEISLRAWRVRTNNGLIRAGHFYQGGLFRVLPGQAPAKIKDGKYSNPLVSADGKWVVVTKNGAEWEDTVNIVRINLQTGKEFPAAVQPADAFLPIAFLPSQNKFLLYRAKGINNRNRNAEYTAESDADGESSEEVPYMTISPRKPQKPNPSPQNPEYYLFDANTGAAQLVKGEFRPLEQMTYRPLQSTATAGEYWAAVYNAKTKTTEIGKYSEKTFAFLPVKQIPDIRLSSMDVWIDEKEAKIYFVYQGHLLALPLAN